MIIPLRTDRPPRRQPAVTELLIAMNLLVYGAGLAGSAAGWFNIEQAISFGHFDPTNFKWWQLITTQFMHDPYSVWHVAFNMLFLWVFGAPVEDRFGRFGFLGFYLIGGAVAALAHMMISEHPVIGASGSVAAVTGAFLALFPRSRILVLFLFGGAVFLIPSPWFIGLYFIIDLLSQTMQILGRTEHGVAYMAHIAGYTYGFALAFVLLAAKIIPREEYDIFFLFKQARRRAALRAANRGTASGAWMAASADTARRLADQRRDAAALSPQKQREMELRAEVNQLAASGELKSAAAVYRDLLTQAPDSVFTESRQLELGNQFCAEQDFAHAAAAYELFLDRYPNSHDCEGVSLLLAVMYTRNLQRRQRAKELIQKVTPTLRDASQIALANQLTAEIAG